MEQYFQYFMLTSPLLIRITIFAIILLLIIVYLIGFIITIGLYSTAYKYAFTEADKNNTFFKIFTFFTIWITSPKHIMELLKILLVTLFGKRRN